MATSGGSRKLPGSSDNDGTWSLVTPDLPVDGLSDLALTVMLEPDRSRIRLDAQTAAVIGVTGSIPDDIGNGILTILPTIPSGPDQASGPAALADHVRTIVFIDSAVSDAELLAACRTRDFRSITTAVRLRRRGHQTAGGAPITS